MIARLVAWAVPALAMLCFIAFGFKLGSLGITDLDEGLYAVAARGMAVTGDLVTPRVNGEPFYEKPPLLYWLAAASIHVLGPTEIAARLPSALGATTLVFLTFWFGSRHLGRSAGVLAASFLAVAPVFVAAGRLITTDSLLCVSVALTLFCTFEMRGANQARQRRLALVIAASCGAGLLAKGAPGIVLPGIVVAGDALWRRLRRAETAGGAAPALVWLAPVLVALVIALPWHIAAYRSSGQAFVTEYLVRQHIQRFRGGDTSHLAPVWFYVPGFVAGCFPWSPFALAGLARAGRRRTAVGSGASEPSCDRVAELRRYLAVWFGVVFVLFSASGSKLISYILPLYPAAALLAGDWCAERIRDQRVPTGLLVGGICATVVTALVLAAFLFPAPVVRMINAYADRPVRLDSIDPSLLRPAVLLTGVAAATAATFSILTALRRSIAALAALPIGMAAFLAATLLVGAPVVQKRWIAPLHVLAREASVAADRAGLVLVAVAPPGRPSALYYVSDGVFRDGRVQLIRSQEIADHIAASAGQSPLLVIAKRDADSLQRVAGANVLRTAGPYQLVQIGE